MGCATIKRATASAPPPERALERIRTGWPALYPFAVMIGLPPRWANTRQATLSAPLNLGMLVLFHPTDIQPVLMNRKHAHLATIVHNLS